MRILHTSDWHVGKTIRGKSRDDEHRAVLAEIAEIARHERIDLVLLAGDIYDQATPPPSAEDIVYSTLLDLTRDGVHVALVSGNHDHPRRFAAVQRFLELAHVHTGAELARAEEGGCIEIGTRNGEVARVALMPWLSQRGIVRAEELMGLAEGDRQGRYQQDCRHILKHLTAGFGPRTVNLTLAHLTIANAQLGGGERAAETIFDYFVPPQHLPENGHYVALGHIHRQQRLPVTWPAWYSGAPLQLDFGEHLVKPGVLVFEATPGKPIAAPEPIPLTKGRPLITVPGTLEYLRRHADEIDREAHVRIQLDEAPRVGLAEAVYELVPNAVKVEIVRTDAPSVADNGERRMARSPRELYDAFLDQQGAEGKEALLDLFDEILAEVTGAPQEA